jgi:3-phosphoshikimate 1-carboxyvinyltransferase
MNSILIKPSVLRGTVIPPPSKSLSHRAIICASLCSGNEISHIDNVILSDDIKATIDAMRQLRAEIEIIENDDKTYCLNVRGNRGRVEYAEINCNESGSTLRFLIPVALMLADRCKFSGKGKLIERPLDIFYKIFDEDTIEYENDSGKLPLTVSGKLRGGHYNISGRISSQFISGLLMALPLINRDSVISVTDNMESAAYVDLTLQMLKKFNIETDNKDYKEYKISGNSKYEASSCRIEADYSQAAFYLVANALGNDVECLGLNEDSLQGDKEIINIIERFKNFENSDSTNCSGSKEIVIDASQIPDLIPIISVLAALQKGKNTHIVNAQRLRVKESDRLKAVATEMNKIGAEIEELEYGLLIKGKSVLRGDAYVNSWNDHRIAMSLAIAATKCNNDIILEGYQSVNKSYPAFWNDYISLGGAINELHMGK